jgi:lysophospholipase L1-like esterase
MSNNNATNGLDTRNTVVACLGASITEAKGSFDWIRELSQRPQNQRFQFHNFGRGGDPAYSALQRLSSVVTCHPDKVVVALGWNDILMYYFNHVRRFMGGWKRLPSEPTPEWFRENMQAIVSRLKAETSAVIGLTSLSQMGENPASTDPVQSDLNRLFKQYSEIVQVIAKEEKVVYIPLYERLNKQLVASPGRDFTAFRFRSMYYDAFRQFVLRQSLDEISQINGWQFHVDGLHLNSRGGMILANLVQEFLDGQVSEL